jgi:hypothetical protein
LSFSFALRKRRVRLRRLRCKTTCDDSRSPCDQNCPTSGWVRTATSPLRSMLAGKSIAHRALHRSGRQRSITFFQASSQPQRENALRIARHSAPRGTQNDTESRGDPVIRHIEPVVVAYCSSRTTRLHAINARDFHRLRRGHDTRRRDFAVVARRIVRSRSDMAVLEMWRDFRGAV